MAKIEHKEFNTHLQLKAVELIKSSIQAPSVPVSAELLEQFDFNVTLETRADKAKRELCIIISTDVASKRQVHEFGNLTLACIYTFHNFDEIVRFSADGKTHSVPAALTEIMNSISLSTARGYMAATFRGTIIHNAFLPIIDPGTFQPAPSK